VANAADDVIDNITGAESTVAAFMSNHPNTSEDAALAHPISRVSGAGSEHAETKIAKKKGYTMERKQLDEESFALEN
jgi:hypothetical protein